MDIERARFNMVEQQIRTWEVLDQDVLDLLYVVRREEFVPSAYRALAFSDLEIPLVPNGDPSEKMLQPKIEARILQEVSPKPSERVLEVGTGSGYMAALLGSRAREVLSIEINTALKEMSARNLARAGRSNVMVEQGDGALGWPSKAPYDVIVMSGSLPILPQPLLEQLAVGGRLFAIVGEPPVMSARLLTCVAAGSFNAIDLFETNLAPLKNAPQPKRFRF
jgi:protein-L-isoaspartate(D-aspartate) O-methyltransferase